MKQTQDFKMSRGLWFATQFLKKLLQIGLPMGPMMLLSHIGRKSGKTYETPVVLVKQGNKRWLVSPFGNVNWAQNVRAAGQAQLRRGNHIETIQLVELKNASDASPILKAFLTQFGIVPFIPPYFEATPQSSLAEFEREAFRHPVFRIESKN